MVVIRDHPANADHAEQTVVDRPTPTAGGGA